MAAIQFPGGDIARAISSRSVVNFAGGRLLSMKLPYVLVIILESSITTAPRSVLERIKRPNPCLSFSVVTGNE